ncbi:hypothetical protein AYI69_g11397 [Smittium culicis]|uniref:Uncharacterized protein n=1 Tax=Smittium culicis TaxID=133412 RepID=A0A1R1WZ28_9FUNG|nr:hypothetical protein AYI69_g11397 [Smittium culicis]
MLRRLLELKNSCILKTKSLKSTVTLTDIGNPESVILNTPIEGMERKILPSRESETGNLHRFQRPAWGKHRTHFEPLSEFKHPFKCYICSNYHDSSRCAEQSHRSNGMVNIRLSFREDISPLRNERSGLIGVENEQEGVEILQSVPRQQICGAEISSTQLVRMVQPLRMPCLESDLPKNPVIQTGAPNHNTGYSVIENSNIVSGSS